MTRLLELEYRPYFGHLHLGGTSMFIPYGTDAPIYYWPFATGAMMLINIVVLMLQLANPEAQAQYMLVHGGGLHPVQWLTSMFMHDGIGHLLGNLIFLWAFGIVVEGKIGPIIFSWLYVGIGVFQSMVEQIMLLPFGDFSGASLGASSAISGLMMIALVWAPQDNLKVIFNPYLFYLFFIEVPIAFFGLVYFLMDFTFAYFSGFSMGTPLLHLMGAVCGLVVGVTFIYVSWVDGEERDLPSMFLELVGRKAIKKKPTRSEQRAIQEHKEMLRTQRQQKIVLYRKSLAAHLAAGNPVAAVATFRQIQRMNKKATWEEADLLKVISAFQSANQWDQTIEHSQIYLDSYQKRKVAVAINLAKIQLLQKGSPRRALKVIAQLNPAETVSSKQQNLIQQIKAKANQMIAAGSIELD